VRHHRPGPSVVPLYLAGFTTAFGALSDRIGAKPVVVGGLVAFVLASLLGVLSPAPLVLALARLGQGAAASAFSPASSSAVARLVGKERLGRAFGRYGAWKSLGYVEGPLLGVALATLWNIQVVYAALALLGACAAVWVAVAMPALEVLPRRRYTLADLVRQTTERGFLVPTLLLAACTAILGVAVGFLPLLATRLGLPPLLGAAAIAVLALTSTLLQPVTGACGTGAASAPGSAAPSASPWPARPCSPSRSHRTR